MNAPSARRDLTQGGIAGALLRLALPIAGSQAMHMAYNLTDMFWMGRIGSDALAATGTAGLFLWLSVGLMLIGKVGTDIGVSQARGRGDAGLAFLYARTGLYIAAVLGLLYGLFMFCLREPLVGLFNFQEQNVAEDMAVYMSIMAFGIPFTFISAAVGSSFGASGNTKTPFIISSIGLTVNMILSPIFIFILGLGIRGAAITSVMAQAGVAATMIIAVKTFKGRPFESYRIRGGWADLRSGMAKQIFKWTIPIFVESTLFCLLTMITSRFAVSFGAYAMAISQVGTQVESLTWLVGAGFGTAVTVFVGQNYGARQGERIAKGVRYAAWMMTGWGLFVTGILFLGGGVIISVFLPDPELRGTGIAFMRIMAACQVPMCLDAVFGNAFKGKGRTMPPSICSITSNVIRVPLAYLLSQTSLGLMGIWIAISFTGCLRGVWVTIWYFCSARKKGLAFSQTAGYN